jgi:acyl dehydratase|tara:strand:+ start:34 stop:525 length:492 start_codon:yes stop_codon:yes gene_type:complete
MNGNLLIPKTKLKVAIHKVSVKSIQNGAVTSRDWAPLHTDQQWAITKGKLPSIIMNNYTLNGLIIKHITDIYGSSSRIGKVSFKIKKPICPGDSLEFHGTVIQKKKIDKTKSWVQIDLLIKANEGLSASAKIYVAVNETKNIEASPWKLSHSKWSSSLQLCQN